MKILLTNNYSMDQAWKRWKEGIHPGHHLWGITHLPKYGIEADILPFEKFPILNKIGDKFRLGKYLDQQVRVFFNSFRYDLIYSGTQETASLLSLLRTLKIFNKPLVSVVHRFLNPKNKRHQILVKGHDLLLCLSDNIKQNILENFKVDQEKVQLLEWGFDLDFYDKHVNNNYQSQVQPSYIMSAGHTMRDYETLIKAYTEIDYPLRIYSSKLKAEKISNVPAHIQFFSGNYLNKHALSYAELIQVYRGAYAVAIPLNIPIHNLENITMIGLTSLLEAMVMGKAVVMTQNPLFSLDIEKEKIVILVEPGHIKGWQQAISYLLQNPQEAVEMGKRGRALCENKHNIELFSSQLASILKRRFLPA